MVIGEDKNLKTYSMYVADKILTFLSFALCASLCDDIIGTVMIVRLIDNETALYTCSVGADASCTVEWRGRTYRGPARTIYVLVKPWRSVIRPTVPHESMDC